MEGGNGALENGKKEESLDSTKVPESSGPGGAAKEPNEDPGTGNSGLKYELKKLRRGCFPDLRTFLRIFALFWTAFLLGLNDAGWGVVLPFFRDHYGLNNSTVSLNFILSVAGFVLSSVSNGIILPLFGNDAGVILGATIGIVGFGLLSGALPFGACLFAFFVLGFSAGLLDAGANILSVRFPIVGNLVLNYFHAIYGIGALVGPPIATIFVANNIPWNRVYLVWLGAEVINLTIMIVGFRVLAPPKDHEDVVLGREAVRAEESMALPEIPASEELDNLAKTAPNETAKSRAETTKAAAGNFRSALKIPLIWISAFYLLFYVGAEVVVGSWAFSFLTVVRGGTTAESGPFVSCYWGGLVCSRLFFMPLTARMGDLWAGMVYTIITTAGLIVMWTVSNIQANAAMLFFIGLGYGPLYPLTITLVSKAFDQRNPEEQAIFATGTGFLVALGSAGAAFFPWFTGLVSQLVGPDGSGVWVFLPISIGLNVLLVVLFGAMVFIVKRRHAERTAKSSLEDTIVAT